MSNTLLNPDRGRYYALSHNLKHLRLILQKSFANPGIQYGYTGCVQSVIQITTNQNHAGYIYL